MRVVCAMLYQHFQEASCDTHQHNSTKHEVRHIASTFTKHQMRHVDANLSMLCAGSSCQGCRGSAGLHTSSCGKPHVGICCFVSQPRQASAFSNCSLIQGLIHRLSLAQLAVTSGKPPLSETAYCFKGSFMGYSSFELAFMSSFHVHMYNFAAIVYLKQFAMFNDAARQA